MKRRIFTLLFLVGLILMSCVTNLITGPDDVDVPEEFLIPRDPNNPFQGTWLHMRTPTQFGEVIITVEGMTITRYEFVIPPRSGALSYLIPPTWEQRGYFFIDSSPDEWRLNSENNILYRMDGSQVIGTFYRKNT